ncbi:nickel ABC transporter substrate-binding protein [Fusobacterium sp. PH5-44]|uniref:nickel ABC transporter substrate-binding protein n=1 Tax=unclassified Fusobacterium TaxID=2648384 RepID=UPI003D2422A0
MKFNFLKSTFGILALSITLVSYGGNAEKKETTKKETSVAAEKIEGKVKSAKNEKKEELVFVNFRDIRDLNPHLYAGEMYAQEMLYETLINLDKNGGYTPGLAESYTISDDGKVYTFKIRKGVKFHDGEICDARAIKANFDAILDNKSRHTWLEMMQLLESIELIDDDTIQIKMSKPYYPMLTELAVTRPFAMISPKAMKNGTTKDGVEAYIGTGPYKLEKNVTDEYAVFVINEDYWGEKPKIKRILVKVIPDNQTRIMALEKGEIDFIFHKNMIDADTVKKYKDDKRFTVALSEPTSTRQILLNTNNKILKDKKVRYAIQHATDKKAISEGIFYGLESPAETLYAKNIPYCNIDLQPYEYNLEKSKELLKEAGWTESTDGILSKDGEKLVLNLLYNNDSVTEKNISEYLQSEFKKVGIQLNISGEEEQSYRDKQKNGKFDMVFNISWGTPYDPQSSMAAMRQRVYGDYEAQLGLPDKSEIDKNITNVLVTTNEEERQRIYGEILTRLHEDAVYLTLTYECNKAIYIKDLKGVEFAPTQYEVKFDKMHFAE